MSETDDTDELLLIPPDLFVIDSEFEEPYTTAPYYKIVDTLITQVSHLEDRLNYITLNSDSTINSSIDYVNDYTTKQMSKEKNYYSMENVASCQSTPQKPRTIFKLNSLPPSPNMHRQTSPNARQFAIPNRDKHVNRRSPLNRDDNMGADVESVDNQSEKMKLLNEIDNFISNVKTKTKSTAVRNLEKDYKNGGGRSLEMREVNAFLNDMETQLGNVSDALQNVNLLTATSVSDIPASTGRSLRSVESMSSSNGSSQITAYHNANHEIQDLSMPVDMHNDVYYNKTQTRRSHRNREVNERPDFQRIENTAKSEADRRLLSLTQLWGQYSTNGDKDIVYKLEEERLRRKHCEDIIQELQQKILELQERVAVAIEVDQSKDVAIIRFQDAWNKVAARLDSLKNDKLYLERDLQELQSQSARDLAEAAKKVAYYETEASKALTLAHSSHEKVTSLENQNAETIMEIDNLQKEFGMMKMEYSKLESKNKQLNEIIAQKDLALKEKEKAVGEALKEVGEGKRTVEICEAEFITMKTQYTQLELDFHEAKDYIKEMEKQVKKLVGDVETYKRIERDLKEENLKSKDTSEKIKQELRNFYQNQVEVVVRDKLREFQQQLESAEKAMKDEIKNRELTVAKTAAQHIQNLEEKHTIEVQLLEEKHLEEIRLYSVKLGQANQRIDNLDSKLQEQSHRRDKIAQQLHKIMEVQWREAIKLINKTPSSPDFYNEQLNQLKSKSYSNLEELLSGKESPVYEKKNPQELGQITDMTPVSSKPRSRQQIESELQKYVQMLLPKSTSAPDTNQNKYEQQNGDKYNWHQELSQDEYNNRAAAGSKGGISRRLMKPPWK